MAGYNKKVKRKTKGAMTYVAKRQDITNKTLKAARVLKNKAAKDKRPLKVAKGTARALRRWQDGQTKLNTPPSILSERTRLKVKRNHGVKKEKTQPAATVMLNGVLMHPQEAAIVARRLLAERKAKQQPAATQDKGSLT